MPPGEFAHSKFTSPKAINSKLPYGNCHSLHAKDCVTVGEGLDPPST